MTNMNGDTLTESDQLILQFLSAVLGPVALTCVLGDHKWTAETHCCLHLSLSKADHCCLYHVYEEVKQHRSHACTRFVFTVI